LSIDTSADPLLQCGQGIWDCLVADTEFARLVPAMNRIDYTGDDRTVDKPGLLTADFPQVRVVLTGLESQIYRTSNSSSAKAHFVIEVKVGDKRLENMTQLLWAIYCAMSRWETYLRDEVEWQGENVVKKLFPMKADINYMPKAERPEPAGWVTAWAGALELFILTTTVQEYEGGT